MSYIAINPNTGNYVKDLGMCGEYPYDSSVGRQVKLDGFVREYWYPTEINPRGKTQLELDTENWVSLIDAPKFVTKKWYNYNNALVVTQSGEGVLLPLDYDFPVGYVLWSARNGYDAKVTEDLKNFLENAQ